MRTSQRLRSAVVVIAGWLLLLALPATASAECFPGSLPPMADDQMPVGDAFLAVVTEASDVAPTSVGGTSRWHVELAVDATYRGRSPKTLAFGGVDEGSCGDLLGEVLQVGDRIIIAAEDLRPGFQPSVPFEGHVLVWHKTAGGWAFFADALTYGAEPDAYPAAARAADSKAEILAFIAASGQPDTATEAPQPEPARGSPSIVIAVAFLLGAVLLWSRAVEGPVE